MNYSSQSPLFSYLCPVFLKTDMAIANIRFDKAFLVAVWLDTLLYGESQRPTSLCDGTDILSL